jgi:hypothetical protein
VKATWGPRTGSDLYAELLANARRGGRASGSSRKIKGLGGSLNQLLCLGEAHLSSKKSLVKPLSVVEADASAWFARQCKVGDARAKGSGAK